MSPYTRLFSAVFVTLIFFVLFCVLWIESVAIQTCLFIAVLCLTAIRFSLSGLWKKIINLSPIILLLALVYCLLGVWGWSKPAAYWLHYGLTRTFILASSLLFMQIVISELNPDHFLNSALSIHKLKYLILGKHLYSVSITAYRELCVFSSMMPCNQLSKLRWKDKFKTRLAVILALIAYVISEATLKGELIDERIRLCHHSEAEPSPNAALRKDLPYKEKI